MLVRNGCEWNLMPCQLSMENIGMECLGMEIFGMLAKSEFISFHLISFNHLFAPQRKLRLGFWISTWKLLCFGASRGSTRSPPRRGVASQKRFVCCYARHSLLMVIGMRRETSTERPLNLSVCVLVVFASRSHFSLVFSSS